MFLVCLFMGSTTVVLIVYVAFPKHNYINSEMSIYSSLAFILHSFFGMMTDSIEYETNNSFRYTFII